MPDRPFAETKQSVNRGCALSKEGRGVLDPSGGHVRPEIWIISVPVVVGWMPI